MTLFHYTGRLLTAIFLVAFGLALVVGCGESATPTPSSPEVIAQGEEVFQRSAGGVGCASCHGTDARGRASAPNIVGTNVRAIERALNRVPPMRFIELDRQEVEAIVAYLQTLR